MNINHGIIPLLQDIVSVTNNRIFPAPQCSMFSQCAIVIGRFIKHLDLENRVSNTLCVVGRNFLCLIPARTVGPAKAGCTGYLSNKSGRDWFVAEYSGNLFLRIILRIHHIHLSFKGQGRPEFTQRRSISPTVNNEENCWLVTRDFTLPSKLLTVWADSRNGKTIYDTS